MALVDFEFSHRWLIAAPPEAVYAVLHDVATYPQWWPQVRAMARISDTAGYAVCRSLAPYSLELRLDAQTVADDELAVDLSGDLDGWCRFRLQPVPGGTRVVFDQHVELTQPTLRRWSRLLRPALRANHAWMMRGCRRGLERRVGDQPSAATAAS